MRVKLLLTYDVLPYMENEYYEFITNEFLQWTREQGLVLSDVWHTLYGDYPMRTIGLVAQDEEHLWQVLNSPSWELLEEHFQQYVTNYEKRVVPYKAGLQL